MAITNEKRNQSVASVLKRLREKTELTTRQAAGIIGVSHTTISLFENGKRELPGFRIEELVKTYGYTMEQFHKVLGHKAVVCEKEDCFAMLELLDGHQLGAIRAVLSQILHKPLQPKPAEVVDELAQRDQQ